MFCTSCGKEVANTDAFCSSCGRSINAEQPISGYRPSVKASNLSFSKIVAIIFGIALLASIVRVATVANRSSGTSAVPSQQVSLIPAGFDEVAAVIKACGKPTKDHPEELHAGAGSEGRALVYRKYNTELWFYRGPRSQEWMLMSALVANGDDSISVDEANKRMPCMRGGLQDHMRAPQNDEERLALERAKTAAENAENAQKASDGAAAARKASDDSDISTRAAIGAASLKAAMRNPDSLQLEHVLGMDDGTICYEYRAQNGFGGMNRETAALLPKAKSLTTSDAAWNKHCANKTGNDLTYFAETLIKVIH